MLSDNLIGNAERVWLCVLLTAVLQPRGWRADNGLTEMVDDTTSALVPAGIDPQHPTVCERLTPDPRHPIHEVAKLADRGRWGRRVGGAQAKV